MDWDSLLLLLDIWTYQKERKKERKKERVPMVTGRERGA